jgi:hypothetical protein
MSHDRRQPYADQPADELLPEDAQQPEEQSGEEQPGRFTGAVSWAVSGAMHATVIMLLGTVYFLSKPADEEIPPVRVTAIPAPPIKPEDEQRNLDRELLEPTAEVNLANVSDRPNPLTQLDLPVEDNAMREEETESTVPKGREEAVADAEMGGSGAFMAIGAGGGGSGMFGSRSGGGKKRAVARGGGSRASESAVDAALRWFKRHQSPNGMWDAVSYPQNCTEEPKCEPGSYLGYGPEQVNMALTGYAVLAFLGAGYDHKTPNRFRQTVKQGIDWIVANQKPDGLLGVRNYEHPVAAMALAEAYAMTGDPALRDPAQRAADIIVQRQNRDRGDSAYGLGWDYTKPSARNDGSVSGWNVMALKSAFAGGLNVGNSMDGAERYLERAWRDTNTNQPWSQGVDNLDTYSSITRFPYTWNTDTGEIKISSWRNGNPDITSHDLAPVGLVLAVFLGRQAGDPILETLANYVIRYQMPTAYPTDTYYLYYNTLGVFQVGGEKWQRWNATVRDLLVNSQRRGDGCFDGSWDWQGTRFHGHGVGRVLSTAYNTLSLEVYYRYAQVQRGPARK